MATPDTFGFVKALNDIDDLDLTEAEPKALEYALRSVK